MRFGVRQKTWVMMTAFFLFVFLSLTFAHLYIPHEHPHDNAYTMMPFLHTTSNQKEATLFVLVAIVGTISLSIQTAFVSLCCRALDGVRILVYALELFRRLFSSGILHSKSH